MMAELTISSWDTIFRRAALMMSGRCSPEEYQRMVWEKAAAAQASLAAMAVASQADLAAAALNPWLRRARANSRRLRRG
jgi:hypothetical protein